MARFADINVSQGSVAGHMQNAVGVLTTNLPRNFPAKKSKSVQI